MAPSRVTNHRSSEATTRLLKVSMDDQQRAKEMLFQKTDKVLVPESKKVDLRPRSAVPQKPVVAETKPQAQFVCSQHSETPSQPANLVINNTASHPLRQSV